MIRISEAVEQLIMQDGFAIEAMQRGILNVSAYAKEIHESVERITMKPVQIGSIIVALSRLSQKINQQQDFNPHVVIDSYSVTSSICEVTFERTEAITERLSTLNSVEMNDGDFFTVTEGLHEVTILLSENARDYILNHFGSQPKVVINNLVAISVRFSTDYMEVPNTIYSLVGALATRHINLMEIVSTYTELTFVVYEQEMEKTIQALNAYSQKK